MKWLYKAEDNISKPFLEHLEELRGTIIRCLVAFGIAFAVAVPLAPWIFAVLTAPLVRVVDNPEQCLRSLEATGAFALAVRIGVWSALLLSAPFLFIFISGFIFPGLAQRERQAVLRSCAFSVGLFIVGALLGYFVILPLAFQVMLRMHSWLGIVAKWKAVSTVAFSIHVVVGFGLAFQMPVVILVLGKLGLVDSAMLCSKRRHMIVGLLVLAMVLTPPDVLTQLMMALPLILLYELCVVLLRVRERRLRVCSEM